MTNRIATSYINGKTPYKAFIDNIEPGIDYRPLVAHFRVLGYKVYILIKKERRVTSRKLAPRTEVGILVGYNHPNIFRVYMPSRARDKIVRTSHVRFDEGGLVTEPDFEAMNDEEIRMNDAQKNQASADAGPSRNKDVERIRFEPSAEFDPNASNDDEFYEAEEGQNAPEVSEEEDEVVDTPEISLQNPNKPPKRAGRPKGSKNRTYDDTPLENRRTTRAVAKSKDTGYSAAMVEDIDGEDPSKVDKGDAYYVSFLAGAEPPTKDPKTVKEALAGPDSEDWRQSIVKEYRALRRKKVLKTVRRDSLPYGTKVLGSKLIFKSKYKNGALLKRKTRFVVRGFE
jgi:hypothetical protein